MVDQDQLSDAAKLNNRLREAWTQGATAGAKSLARGDLYPPDCPYPLIVFKTRAVGRTTSLLESLSNVGADGYHPPRAVQPLPCNTPQPCGEPGYPCELCGAPTCYDCSKLGPDDKRVCYRHSPAARELRAVRVLDAWLAKRGDYVWQIDRFRDGYLVRVVTVDGMRAFEPYCATPALARIAAADALVKEDPSLLEAL